jgi:hypothetical protein
MEKSQAHPYVSKCNLSLTPEEKKFGMPILFLTSWMNVADFLKSIEIS